VELLLENGAEVHIRDDEGKTPLSVAVEEGPLRVREILRHYGAAE
jgi:ankyrin repeat protein